MFKLFDHEGDLRDLQQAKGYIDLLKEEVQVRKGAIESIYSKELTSYEDDLKIIEHKKAILRVEREILSKEAYVKGFEEKIDRDTKELEKLIPEAVNKLPNLISKAKETFDQLKRSGIHHSQLENLLKNIEKGFPDDYNRARAYQLLKDMLEKSHSK